MRLVVACHLHLWQNDRDLLRATAVTRGWNGYEIRVSTENWRRKKKKKKRERERERERERKQKQKQNKKQRRRNKSQHRKLEKKEEEILSLLLRGPEPGTFRSPVRRSDH